MSNLLEQNTNVCRNGHQVTERVRTGGAYRCPECVREQKQRRREREKAGLAPTKRQRAKMPVCPQGCIKICLCEEL